MFLAIDFGASRIKSIYFKNSKKIISCYETNGSLYYDRDGIVKNTFFIEALIKHLNFYEIKKYYISKILVCSEMHGYAVWDQKKISNYFSWRFFKKKKLIINKKKYTRETGIYPREGIPYFKINKFYKKKICTVGIAEILCISSKGSYNNTLHSTYAQSLGFYNLNRKNKLNIKKELSNINSNISINYNYKNFVGKFAKVKKKYDVFGGFGDLQSALGNNKIESGEVYINLGTGSQIVFPKKNKKFEFRITFNNNCFACVSHIPSGRYFLLIKKYFKLDDKIFFSNLKKVKLSSNFKFKKKLYNLNLKTYLDYLKKNNIEICDYEEIFFIYLNQYIQILKKIPKRKIYLSGGISKKLENFKYYLQKEFKSSKIILLNKKSKLDNTLLFLKKKYKRITYNDKSKINFP